MDVRSLMSEGKNRDRLFQGGITRVNVLYDLSLAAFKSSALWRSETTCRKHMRLFNAFQCNLQAL